jgi:hypothetical protein
MVERIAPYGADKRDFFQQKMAGVFSRPPPQWEVFTAQLARSFASCAVAAAHMTTPKAILLTKSAKL